MKWISVKDRLPEIPKGKYGLTVLVAEFDSCYEECCPGHGYSVHTVSYGSIKDRNSNYLPAFKGWGKDYDFMKLYIGGKVGSSWGPICDEITHWMYLPDPPKREEP